MIEKLSVFVVAAALAAPAWTAESDGQSASPKQEKIGVGSGAAIGAMAGGPIGVILGAALGGWLGNRFHTEHAGRVESERQLAASRENAASLEALLDGSEHDLAELKARIDANRREYRSALQSALDVQVMFQTAESELDPAAAERLGRLAGLIKGLDDVVVVVDGYADPRGDEEYNDQLSAARAASVRDVLIASGIAAERITTRAEGERLATAAEDDPDALALERRVHLRLVAPSPDGAVAQD
jgi:outer membrane protein OmpA-like peptidoglycan-associated protein